MSYLPVSGFLDTNLQASHFKNKVISKTKNFCTSTTRRYYYNNIINTYYEYQLRK